MNEYKIEQQTQKGKRLPNNFCYNLLKEILIDHRTGIRTIQKWAKIHCLHKKTHG